jgi:hypothetical protein
VSFYILVFFLMLFPLYLHSSSIFSHHPNYVIQFLHIFKIRNQIPFPLGGVSFQPHHIQL